MSSVIWQSVSIIKRISYRYMRPKDNWCALVSILTPLPGEYRTIYACICVCFYCDQTGNPLSASTHCILKMSKPNTSFTSHKGSQDLVRTSSASNRWQLNVPRTTSDAMYLARIATSFNIMPCYCDGLFMYHAWITIAYTCKSHTSLHLHGGVQGVQVDYFPLCYCLLHCKYYAIQPACVWRLLVNF
eukprot:137037_1